MLGTQPFSLVSSGLLGPLLVRTGKGEKQGEKAEGKYLG